MGAYSAVLHHLTTASVLITPSSQALLDNPAVINRASVFAMASINVANLLGVRLSPYDVDLVATSGGDLLGFEGKVVAVISPRRGRVDFLEPQP